MKISLLAISMRDIFCLFQRIRFGIKWRAGCFGFRHGTRLEPHIALFWFGDGWVGPDYGAGLSNLKKVAEAEAAGLAE